MVKIEGSIEEIRELIGDVKRTVKRAKKVSKQTITTGKKVKRKLTDYQRFLKRELPKLKKKFPRTPQPSLMKKAAKMWKASKRGGKK